MRERGAIREAGDPRDRSWLVFDPSQSLFVVFFWFLGPSVTSVGSCRLGVYFNSSTLPVVRQTRILLDAAAAAAHSFNLENYPVIKI